MNEYELAAALAGVPIIDVLSARFHGDGSLVAVINKGIAGAPKVVFTADQVAQEEPDELRGTFVSSTDKKSDVVGENTLGNTYENSDAAPKPAKAPKKHKKG